MLAYTFSGILAVMKGTHQQYSNLHVQRLLAVTESLVDSQECSIGKEDLSTSDWPALSQMMTADYQIRTLDSDTCGEHGLFMRVILRNVAKRTIRVHSTKPQEIIYSAVGQCDRMSADVRSCACFSEGIIASSKKLPNHCGE